MASQSGFLDNKSAISPLFGFLAGGFADNPSKVAKWISRLSSLKESHMRVVILGLWYANLSDSQERVYEILENSPNLHKEFAYLKNGSPLPVDKIPLKQGTWVLDALWGNFFATGDKKPVTRIISALPWVDVRGDVNLLMVGGAAKWSLTSNAIQHERVLKFCKEELNHQTEDVVEKLREVLDSAKSDDWHTKK